MDEGEKRRERGYPSPMRSTDIQFIQSTTTAKTAASLTFFWANQFINLANVNWMYLSRQQPE